MEEQDRAVQTDSVAQAPEDTTRPVSEPEAPSVADAMQQQLQAQPESAPSPSHDQEGGDDTEHKSRLERRVDSLVDKLKAQGQQPQIDASQFFGNEPIFSPEEIEAGQFDPIAVSQRLQQREQRVQALAAQQAVAAVEYQATVKDHLSDMDTVAKELGNDPVLDKLVAKQYDALNHQVDPRTGIRVFVPTVKMSEIYKDLKDALDKKSTAATADMQVRVANQASEQAVPVSVSGAPSKDLEGQAAFQKAAKTGQTEDWAEVLKKRIK